MHVVNPFLGLYNTSVEMMKMTTTTNRHEYLAPNGNTLRRVSRPIAPVNVEALKKERDMWYEENKHLLKGYSVQRFLEEKHQDGEEGPA